MEQVVNYDELFAQGTLPGVIETAGPSITLTSLTDILAFALGAALSNIPGIRWFCLYAITCIFFDYLYQITFFIALMKIDDQRVRARRRDFVCCSKKLSSGLSDDNSNNRDGSLVAAYTKELLRPSVKILVLVFFGAIFVLGCLNATYVTVEFSIRDLTTPGSETDRFLETEAEYFADPSLTCHIYVRNMSSPEAIEEFLDSLIATDYVANRPEPFIFDAFQEFATQELLRLSSGSNTTSIESLPSSLLENFLTSQPQWIRDVSLDYESGQLVAFRAEVTADVDRFGSVRHQVEFLKEQRRIALQNPLNANITDDDDMGQIFLFHEEFPVMEHFRVIPTQLFTTLGMCVVAVTSVCCCFFPYPSGTLLSMVVVIVVNVELLGLIHAAGKHINTITVLLLVMQVGLTVDYCLHVIFAFQRIKVASSPELPVNEIVVGAMKEVGMSVLNGGCTTLLGILLLGFADGEVFWTFFVVYCAMVVLGVAHGLVFLPVALSMLPSESPMEVEEEANESDDDEVDKSESYRTENVVLDEEDKEAVA